MAHVGFIRTELLELLTRYAAKSRREGVNYGIVVCNGNWGLLIEEVSALARSLTFRPTSKPLRPRVALGSL